MSGADLKPLRPGDATPGRGPFRKPWLDRAPARLAAAVAVVALLGAAVLAMVPPQ